MRNALALAIVAIFAASSAGQDPASVSPFDKTIHNFRLPKELSSCGLESTLIRIARETRVPVGVERLPKCEQRTPSMFPEAVNRHGLQPVDSSTADMFDGISAKELLGYLAARAPDYEWAIMDGVAVFRPRPAWADSMSPLAARVPTIRFSEQPIHGVMETILNLPISEKNSQYPITINFPGGTVIDALNLIVRTQAFAWYANSHGGWLSVGLMMTREGSDFGISAPIAGLSARR
jgi:hypothetical protein